jgi:hypothetical protein
MEKGNFKKTILSLMAFLLLLSACDAGGSVLPLVDYTDPNGQYSFQIPEGWQSEFDNKILTLTPPDYKGTEEELVLRVYGAPTNTIDTATHVKLANEQLDAFLSLYLDPDFEVVNEGETTVSRYPAMIRDFAKPHKESYMLGRLVIVATPFYVLVFLGSGLEADWEAFLPTYRQMLNQFQMISALEPEE